MAKAPKKKFVLTRNTVSGVVAEVPAHYLDIPALSENLEVVEEGTKNLVPGIHKPETAAARKSRKAAAAEENPEVVHEPTSGDETR